MAYDWMHYTQKDMRLDYDGSDRWWILDEKALSANARFDTLEEGGSRGLFTWGLMKHFEVQTGGSFWGTIKAIFEKELNFYKYGYQTTFGAAFDQKGGYDLSLMYDVDHHGIMMPGDLNQDDFFITQHKSDVVYAGGGDDRVSTEKGNDYIDGGAGNDKLYGGGGKDTIKGGDGDDYISGDQVFGIDAGGNVFDGDGIPGWIEASFFGGFNEVVLASADWSGFIEDVAHAGNDLLIGGAGNDTIDGGHGGDWMNGGSGEDVLIGGARTMDGAKDVMIGGADADTFFVTAAETSDEADDAMDAVEGFLSDYGMDIAQSALQAVVGGLAGSAGPLAGFVGEQLAAGVFNGAVLALGGQQEESSKASTTTVLDFDPREDVIVLPQGGEDGKGFDFMITERIPNEVALRDGQTPSYEKVLVVRYGEGSEWTEFAEIFLAPAFLNDLGISGNSEQAEAIFAEITATMVSLDENGASNFFTAEGTFVADDGAGTGVTLLGAIGSKVMVNNEAQPTNAAMIGTHENDAITSNFRWIEPGTEATAESVNATEATNIFGFGGDDLLQGSVLAEKIDGGAGDDMIYTMGASGGRDEVEAGAGDDQVFAGADFRATETFDEIRVDGGEGFDTMSFQYASDAVILTDAGARIIGHEAGHPGGGAAVAQYELTGVEKIVGTQQADRFEFTNAATGLHIDGHAGADTIDGSSKGDVLGGGAQNDWIDGQGGSDMIDGGTGNDVLFGGAGEDGFKFGANHGEDRVMDYNRTEGDWFDFSGLDQMQNFGDMMQNHARQRGDTIYISTGEGTVILDDTQLSDLSIHDFSF